MRLRGKVAIVTGGARNIGAVYARKLAAEGAAVVIADVLDGGEVVSQIEAEGGKAIALQIDVSNEEAVTRMAAEAVKSFGGIDILVNNAAIFINLQRQPFYDITAEEWDRVSAVNILVRKGCFPADEAAEKREDHQHLVIDGFLGHPNVLALCSV